MIDAAPARGLTIVPAGPSDQAFVAATFAEQLSRGNHDAPNSIVDRVLDASATRVLVAIEHDRIVGWLAYAAIPRVRAVLFVYVRRQRRLGGVARELEQAAWPQLPKGGTGWGFEPGKRGAWVHAGLRGGSTSSLLKRFPATEMSLDELL